MAQPPMPTNVRRAAVASSALVLVLLTAMVTAGSFDLFARPHRAVDFHEAQARAWFDGGWAIEPGVLGIEAFEIGDEEHTYFGVVPTLLRVPVVALTDGLDGRLTQSSILVAVGVTLAALSSASWSTRCLTTPGAPVGRRDIVVAAAVPFVCGAGTVVLFLASRPWVYHEAIMWGVAWVVVSAAAVIRFLLDGRTSALLVASGAALAALHSRATVATGALAALAVVGGIVLVRAWHPASEPARARLERASALLAPGVRYSRGVVAVVALTLIAAVGSYVAINQIRFGEPLRLPLERQTIALMSEERQEVLAANGGSLFGLRFVPTTLAHYARPDGIDLGRVFPFVGFPSTIDVLGAVRFDTLGPTTSVPATMPVLALGAVLGAWITGRALRRGRPVAALAIPLAGTAIGGITCLTIGYLAERYKGDLLPFLLLASLPLVHAVAAHTGRTARVGVVALCVLAAWGVAANGALGVLYQRQVAPGVRDELRAGLLGMQLDVASWVPGARLPAVQRGDALPEEVADGVLFVLGECQGLYWGDGVDWTGVERTAATGRWELDVRWPEIDPGAIRPLLSSGEPGAANVLVAVDHADGRVSIGYVWDDPASDERTMLTGRPVEVDRDGTHRLHVVHDPHNVETRVDLDGLLVYEGYRFHPRSGDELGTSAAGDDVLESFGGQVRALPIDEPTVCRELVDRR